MSRADELDILAHDEEYGLLTGYERAYAIIEELEAEIARMRPVVEAAVDLFNSRCTEFYSKANAVCRTVAEYEAPKKGGQGG